MNDVNIDDFYHDIGIILLSLFQQFPRKVSLFIDDISGPDEMDEFGLHSQRYLSAVGALMWLHDEGYIRYLDIIKQESAEECTLTQKAFVKLITPNLSKEKLANAHSIEKRESTLAFQIQQALREQSSIDMQRIIEQYFFHAF
ncbi:hypothetical protein NBRC116188_05110 [Oceaniserpentilla sp. 4NH20-0058]|uniref:hypothetical protein n=1 Tax=Oceaniserpentilla sp. 4NH20-0058 TaxID=3127660 RepID=UPI003102C8B9